jgi:hypothetical protein
MDVTAITLDAAPKLSNPLSDANILVSIKPSFKPSVRKKANINENLRKKLQAHQVSSRCLRVGGGGNGI